MTATALLYRPTNNWQVGVAFGAAALIHFAAIALANVHAERTGGPPFTDPLTEVTFEPPDTVIDPPAEDPDPLTTPPPQNDQSFPEERSTPPPTRPLTNKLIMPIRKPNNGLPGSHNLSSAKILAINAPRPEYPYEARRQRITGDGIAVMTIDSVSGKVSSVSMSKSTGSPFLDNAALTGFRRWRFKPGTASPVICPITFTLMGASY